MIIQWIGHASFLIETGGRKIITDPYEDYTGYPILGLAADIVTVSHEHRDHNAVHHVAGSPHVVRGNGSFDLGDIQIEGIPSFHDNQGGAVRGRISIYRISSEGLNLVHLSDLGLIPDEKLIKLIGQPDILFIPVGGLYTIDAAQAAQTVQLLAPRIVIPMHYKTPHCSFEIGVLEEFTSHFDKYIKLPRLEIAAADLGSIQQIVVLDYLAR